MGRALAVMAISVLCILIALAVVFLSSELSCEDEYPGKPTPAEQRRMQMEAEKAQKEYEKALAIRREIQRQVKSEVRKQLEEHVRTMH